ncbi:glycosyltransferase [Schleiferiaceae bacterium]|nr:glycosyltransferase [Schleiferiaceae bacterium]
MGRGKLGIISDTAVTFTQDGEWRGYEPVVKEIEYFLKYWDEIEWMAYEFPASKTIYSGSLPKTVHVKAVSPLGGASFFSKLKIVGQYVRLFFKVYKLINAADEIHVRAPAHPAVCAMLLAPLFPQKNYWFKYAGSWVDAAPKSYEFQRKLLRRISKGNIYTTVNGNWVDSNSNIIAFENPCFSASVYDLSTRQSELTKEPNRELRLVYVGSLSEFKGVHLVIEALERINFKGISSFTIIGTGEFQSSLAKFAEASPYKERFIFKGKQTKEEVFKILEVSDLLIIASTTEGFPKVISEAMMNYCVPISTRVSCIDQYINDEIGFMIDERSVDGIAQTLKKATSDPNLSKKKQNARALAARFTYENYLTHLFQTVFKNK